MVAESSIREAFPEIDDIEEASLQDRVVAVWAAALEESTFEDLTGIPWWPPRQETIGQEKTTVAHIREVTRCATVLVDALDELTEVELDRDIVIAGALVHDVSKLYEMTGAETNEFHELIPHPHYSVHLLAAAGCSVHLQHIALAHSGASAVEPKTLEAMIVGTADSLVVDGVYASEAGVLKHVSAASRLGKGQ